MKDVLLSLFWSGCVVCIALVAQHLWHTGVVNPPAVVLGFCTSACGMAYTGWEMVEGMLITEQTTSAARASGLTQKR